MVPFKMSPCFKQYLWGGNNLKIIYKKNTPEPPVAESWEISALSDGLSIVDGGIYDKMTIPELCEKFGSEFFGDSMSAGEPFPLLLKILDANDSLSVQVHPDDNYAMIHENGCKGKTEAWYILHAEPGAKLIYGFKDTISTEEFKIAIKDNKTEDVLNYVECNKGDVFYIPAGMVHAIGKGLIIAEIQQSSNITYRVYDYNRRGADGKLRDLHIEKALAVSNTISTKGKEKVIATSKFVNGNLIKNIISDKFFYFYELCLENTYTLDTNNLFHIIFVSEGDVNIDFLALTKGDSAIVPASVGKYTIKGKGKILLFYCKKEA